MDKELQNFMDIHGWIDAGRRLIEHEVQKFESDLIQAEHDVAKRIKLVGYYFDRSFSDKSVLPKYAIHILWFIENSPEHAVFDVPETNGSNFYDNRECYVTLKKAWETKIEESWTNAKLLANAGDFYSIVDKNRAIELLERANKLDPTNQGTMERLALTCEMASKSGKNAALARRATELRQLLSDSVKDDFLDSALADLCAASYESGDKKKAGETANQILEMNGTKEVCPDSLHIAHTILGHLALDDDKVEIAVGELLLSGDVSSSPVLSSFGPKFTLASRLLKRGKRNAVAAYLKKCSSFWKSGQALLLYWLALLYLGKHPTLNKCGATEISLPCWLEQPAARCWKVLRLR